MTEIDTDQFRVTQEPYYKPVGNEIEQFAAAYDVRMPVMLKVRRAAESRGLSNTWRGS